MRKKLIEILKNKPYGYFSYEEFADYLIENGVIVTPCVAMVEQFIKNGKFDNKHTAHNGRMAVIYYDKSKWLCPLIDITEQFYDAEKAIERINTLKRRIGND